MVSQVAIGKQRRKPYNAGSNPALTTNKKINKMKQEKIYCGSGKKKSDTWLQASINLDKIKEHIQEYKGSRFIKVNINVKAEPDQYGKDVSISIDTWKPEESEFKQKPDKKFIHDNTPLNDLPF
jgi:hypothetical protein